MLPIGCMSPHLNCIISPFCVSADSELAYLDISVASLKLAERPEAQNSLLLLIKEDQVIYESALDRGFGRFKVPTSLLGNFGIITAHLVLCDEQGHVAHVVDTGQLLVLPSECAAEVQEVFQHCVQHIHQFCASCTPRTPDTPSSCGRISIDPPPHQRAVASPSNHVRQPPGDSTQGSNQMVSYSCSLFKQMSDPAFLYIYEHYLQPFVQHWVLTLQPDATNGQHSDSPAATATSRPGLQLLYFLLDNSMWSTAVLLLGNFPQIAAEVSSTGISIPALAENPADLQQLLEHLPRQETAQLPAIHPPEPCVLEEMRKRSKMYAFMQVQNSNVGSLCSNLPSFLSSYASGSDILQQLGALQQALAEEEALLDELEVQQPQQQMPAISHDAHSQSASQSQQQQEHCDPQYAQLPISRQAALRKLSPGIDCNSSSSHGLTLSTDTDQVESESECQGPDPQGYAGYLPLHSSLERRRIVSGKRPSKLAAAELRVAAGSEERAQQRPPRTTAMTPVVLPIAARRSREEPGQMQLGMGPVLPAVFIPAAGPSMHTAVQVISSADGTLQCGHMTPAKIPAAVAAAFVSPVAADVSGVAAAGAAEGEGEGLTASIGQPAQQSAGVIAAPAAPSAHSRECQVPGCGCNGACFHQRDSSNSNSPQEVLSHSDSHHHQQQQQEEGYPSSSSYTHSSIEAPVFYHNQFKELAYVSLTGFKDHWLEQSYLVFKNHSCALLDATAAIVCFAELIAATSRSFSPSTDPLAYQKLLTIIQYALCFFFPYIMMHLHRQLYLRHREPLIVFGRVVSGGVLILVALGILAPPDAWVAAVGKTASMQLQNGFILPCCQQLRMPAAATIAVLHFASDAFMFGMALSSMMSVLYSTFIFVCSLLVWLGVDVWCRYVFMQRYLGAVGSGTGVAAASRSAGGFQ